jgi:cytoskeletal protein CcmA (bactofilin family)
MALFAKDEKVQRPEGGTPVVATPVVHPESAPYSAAAVQAHLGKGSRVEGRLTFEGSVEIDGAVDGEIQAQQAVMIGENAVVAAQVVADVIIVKGKVTGDVTARKQVELHAPARLLGNITTPSLVIHDGVFFEGHCSMGGAESKSDRGDRKVALFPKEERSNTSTVRMPSEAVK